MTSAYPPVVNVAHIAGPDGKCARCGAGIGSFVQVADADIGALHLSKHGKPGKPMKDIRRPWKEGERVIEYEMPNGRTGFADQAFGFTIDCRE